MRVVDRLCRTVAPWGRALLNLLYPRVCRVCNTPLPVGREWTCSRCEGEFGITEPPYCSRCGEGFDGAIDREFSCSNCADRKLSFDFAFARFRAEGSVRDLIHRFKYNGELSLRAALGHMLLEALREPRLAHEDLTQWHLVPVPLHHSRRRERGFNQAHHLCRQLNRARKIPLCDALRRSRDTGHQADLTRAQRLENLRNAFEARRGYRGETSKLRGAKVLLVDDVFTTGATTDACARVLRRDAGVEKVVVIAVARG